MQDRKLLLIFQISLTLTSDKFSVFSLDTVVLCISFPVKERLSNSTSN